MNDDAPGKRSRPGTPAGDAAAGAPGAGAPEGAAPPDEAAAALERLQSLAPGASSAPPVESRPGQRSTSAVARSRPRPVAAPSTGRKAARIAAPVAFLVAVIVLISIGFQSGVIGGSAADTTPGSPTPEATNSAKGDASKPEASEPASSTGTYKVKSGDTLSGIAAQFDTTVRELESLNPDVSSSTLVVGQKLVVPKP